MMIQANQMLINGKILKHKRSCWFDWSLKQEFIIPLHYILKVYVKFNFKNRMNKFISWSYRWIFKLHFIHEVVHKLVENSLNG